MNLTRRRSEQGIAIIIVMVSIFALAVLVGSFAYSMKVETRLAMNSNNESQLQDAGRSGIDYCRLILSLSTKSKTGQRYDSRDQRWSGGHSETNQALQDIQDTDIVVGPGVIIRRWSIVDTERRFNINQALNNPAILQKALILAGTDASEVSSIVACIQDWVDRDSETHIGGAESDYYQSLDPPYVAKNGPIDDLSELLLIKPIREHPEIYWGSAVTNHAPTIFQPRTVTRAGIQASDTSTALGLTNYLTTVSSGLINILTASPSQLQMLPNVDETVAEQIYQMGQEQNQDQGLPYSSPAELLFNTPLGRELAQQIAPYCTFRSSTFEITVVVEVGMSKRTYYALVRRNSLKDIPILQMHWADGDQLGAVPSPDSGGPLN